MTAPEPTQPLPRRESISRQVLWVLWITMALNFLSAGFKLAIGILSHNLTVISDAVHGFLDGANNVVGIIAIKVAWRPPDANHPYGHRKFEALAALAIGALMTVTSWEILRAIIRRYLIREQFIHPTNSLIFIAAVLGGLAINIFVSQYEAHRGRVLGSTFLIADALHTRSDIFVTLGSLSSLLIAPYFPAVDGALSVVIVFFILHSGWQVLRDNVLLLTDAAQMDPEPIRKVVESVEGVINCHAIRSHGMPDEIHLDLHIVVRPELTAAQTHTIEAEVRERLFHQFPRVADVSIHHQTEMPVTHRPITRPEPHPEE